MRTGQIDRETAKKATSYKSELSLHAGPQNIVSYKDEIVREGILYWHIFQYAVTRAIKEVPPLSYCSNYNK
jgi:hypothetical protein